MHLGRSVFYTSLAFYTFKSQFSVNLLGLSALQVIWSHENVAVAISDRR